MRTTLALCLIAGFAGSAGAEDLFPRDASCKHVVTVQYQNCKVKTYFRCGADEQIIRAEEVVQGKLRKATVYTADLALIESGDESGKVSIMPIPESATSIDLAALLEGQQQSYSMEIEMSMFGMTRSGPYLADVTLLPETEVIDGIEFQRIEEIANWAMPQPIGTISGVQIHYVSEVIGFPLLGESSLATSESVLQKKNIPAEIIFPDEAGFDSEEPKYGCEELSGLSLPLFEAPV